MAFGGLAFGALAHKRPFGNGILLHPLMVFFALVFACLIVLRFVLARRVSDVISDRALVTGCVIGLVLFLAANFVAVGLLAQPR
jgi:Kef-type K+ transport system membrane component KefB